MKKWKIVVLICLSIVLVYAVGYMLLQIKEYGQARQEYSSLSEKAFVKASDNDGNSDEVTVTGVQDDTSDTPDAAKEIRRRAYQIDFSYLSSVNPDVVGWVLIEGTNVNYPIVKSADNAEYLKLTFEGERSSCGSIFMERENSPDFSDKTTFIYGHNMKDGSMFHTLNDYSDEQFYKEHPTVYIFTPESTKVCKIVSAHVTANSSTSYQIGFGTQADYEAYLNTEKRISMYDTGIVPQMDKNTIVLSTCRGTTSSQRFILVLQEET